MTSKNSGRECGCGVEEIPVIILCGGMGTRMGAITRDRPKSLIAIQGRPIIWYIVLQLYKDGFRNFFLPLGYKGSLIKDYIESELSNLPAIRFHCADTGINTSIAGRLKNILAKYSLSQTILLLNGDAIFDISLSDIYQTHISSGLLVSLVSVEPRSHWSLILDGQDGVHGFVRGQNIRYIATSHTPERRAYVYSGIAFINRRAFGYIDLAKSNAFEPDLFQALIEKRELANLKTSRFWFSIDTPKDVSVLSQTTVGAGFHVNTMRENIVRYFDTTKGSL